MLAANVQPALRPRLYDCLLWLLFALLASTGCADKKKGTKRPKEREAPPGAIIRSVEVEGVNYFEKDEFLSYLNLQPTPALTFAAKHYYVPGLETVDEERILELYQAHGHYDVKVIAIEVEVETKGNEAKHQRKVERRQSKGKRPPKALKQIARVRIAVQEGGAAKVRRRSFEWGSVESSDPALDKTQIEAEATLAPGEVFSIPNLQADAGAMRAKLRQLGYAHATVQEKAAVHRREKWADISFRIEPGQAVQIGQIHIEGLKVVPRDLVAREVEDYRDRPFSPALTRRIEKSIYAMEVFSAVSVVEGQARGDGTIDLTVKVQEAKLQSYKLGVGFGIDPIRWEQSASIRYRHDSIFGRLTRMEAGLRAGYAQLPALYNPQQHGPIAELDLTFRKKGLLEKELVWLERPSIELGIWDGYQFWTVRNRLGVSRFFTRYFETGLSYNNRFADFFNISPTLNENETLLGQDFRDPYFVSYLALEATVHAVDDMVNPHNGARLRTGYDIANRYLGSQFNFHRIPIELRGYYRPHDRVQLSARARVGFIIPYGREEFAGVPIDLKWYLGGAYDVRGWPLRQLSPRVEGNCNDEGQNCEQIPVGGNTEVLGNLELRARLVSELWAAAFLDGGDVRPGTADIVPAGWQATTGGGLRYESPIGSIRLDFGWRLTRDDDRFPVEERFLPNDDNYAIHLAIGEAF